MRSPSLRCVLTFALLAASAGAAPLASIRPVNEAQRPLNFGFEDEMLKDWTAVGEAFKGQPVKGPIGDPNRPDGAGRVSNHQGECWIGGYVKLGDKPKGMLTSAPFKVTQPWASFLIGGGSLPGTRVEVVTKDDGKVIHTARGANFENMARSVIDLRMFAGREIFIRIVDEETVGWGHVNFDDFVFHSEAPPASNTPAAAPKEPSFVNTLGMKFVKVPGINALFSIWETRVRDYAEYAKSNPNIIDPSWSLQKFEGMPVSRDPDHPVGGVSWFDANAFCKWLTEKELAEKKLPKGAVYRLPTDLEWSAAVALEKEEGANPKERSAKGVMKFSWGVDFPPKNKVGNFADESVKAAFPSRKGGILEGYTDGFPTTSPVGSFPPNPLGIYDLSGNVWEWCEDRFEPGNENRVLRGGCFLDPGPLYLYSSTRTAWPATNRQSAGGFRCILTYDSSPIYGTPATPAPTVAARSTSVPAMATPPAARPIAPVALAPAAPKAATPRPTPIPAPPPNDPIVGRWRLRQTIIVFKPNGGFHNFAPNYSEEGRWSCIGDGSPRRYKLNWSDGRHIEELVMSGDKLKRKPTEGGNVVGNRVTD